MSQHPSLKVGGAAEAKRTVLTRYERVELLRKRREIAVNGDPSEVRRDTPAQPLIGVHGGALFNIILDEDI